MKFMTKKKCLISYADIVSLENLFSAWEEFVREKRNKKDVQEFGLHLADNILVLHRDLANKTYRHGGYTHFVVTDPKRRDIHKASVRDRLVHHALHRQLYPFFDRLFAADAYSARKGKGTHRAMNRFRARAYKASRNNTRTCWVLKCDIRKFFASVNHGTLLRIFRRHNLDADTVRLLEEVIGSFNTRPGVGLPLGNLTSQLLVNVYMNEFDRFVKHTLKARYYVRYADDFLILSHDRRYLVELVPKIAVFVEQELKLSLHPSKVSIKTLASGADFLGWVHFPDHRVLRTTTKRRMFKRLAERPKKETVQSYLGLLKHGNTRKLVKGVLQ